MGRIMITSKNLLNLAEFKALLDQLEVRSSATDYALRLMQELLVFEEKFEMPSDLFYARFMRGDMGDDLQFIKWAGRYELYLEAKQQIDMQMLQMPVAAP